MKFVIFLVTVFSSSLQANILLIDDFNTQGTFVSSSSLDRTYGYLENTSVSGMAFECCRSRSIASNYNVSSVFGNSRNISMRSLVSTSGGDGAVGLSYTNGTVNTSGYISGEVFNQRLGGSFMSLTYESGISI